MPNTNQPRRTLLLTGASRGIGHATVKRFSAAGWRVITCSRHGFPENCPWDAGPEDHIQVDLSNEANTVGAIAEIKRRLVGHELHALVNNAAISPKAEGGKRLGSIESTGKPATCSTFTPSAPGIVFNTVAIALPERSSWSKSSP